MALADNELFASRNFAGSIRMKVKDNKPAKFAASAGAELLVPGTPIAWNSSTKLWVPYTQPSDAAVYTITDQNAGTDGGTFDLFIDGLAVVDIDWDELVADVQTKINAVLADAGKPYTVACTCTEVGLGVASAVLTITFSENAGAPTVAINTEKITDGGVSEPGNLVLAASNAGTALNDTNVIAAFIAHDSVQLDAADEVLGVIMLTGEIHRDDVNTAAIRALLAGTPSENELDTALKQASLREKGIIVRGLASVAG
jgi:hypothetical protein